MPDTMYDPASSVRNGMRKRLYMLASGGFLAGLIILYFWAPFFSYNVRKLYFSGAWWLRIDWMLVAIFLFMTIVVALTADVIKSIPFIIIGLLGGLAIEAWGTQTEIWTYYTRERPPLWIIPAWPTATLTIDWLARILGRSTKFKSDRIWQVIYWSWAVVFLLLLISFSRHTMPMITTVFAWIISFAVLCVPQNYRVSALILIAGTSFGFFLELWGTTRHCWNYWTRETPPVFAVMAHGIASLVFWRCHKIADRYLTRYFPNWQGHWSNQTEG